MSKFGFAHVSAWPISGELAEVANNLARVLSYAGELLPQNSDGERITALSGAGRAPDWFIDQPFHTDAGDVLALLCIHVSGAGGVTRLLSAQKMMQIISSEHPGVADLFFDEWYFHRGERPGPAYYSYPVFARAPDGSIDCFLLPGTIRETEKRTGIVLPPEKARALELFENIADRDGVSLQITLAPGDLLLINNKKVLHARSAYADNPTRPPRLLLRGWLRL